MGDIINALQDARVSTILVLAGIFFLFLAIGGRFGATIITDRVKPRHALVVGILLLLAGITLSMPIFPPPSSTPTPVALSTPTIYLADRSPTLPNIVVPSATNTATPALTIQPVFSSATCPPKIGQNIHISENTNFWSQPGVINANIIGSLPVGTPVYIINGPAYGRIRLDSTISGWWWEVSETPNGTSLGWIWEGRIAECNK